MKLEIQYQGSIKTLLFGNSYKNLSNLASGDDKTNANKLEGCMFRCFELITKFCIFTFVLL